MQLLLFKNDERLQQHNGLGAIKMFTPCNTQFTSGQCELKVHLANGFAKPVAWQALVWSRYLICVVAVLAVATGVCSAADEIIIVNTVEDVIDFGGAQQLQDLPGPDGRVSFREACFAANNTAGPQTISFAIPSTEWWLFDNRALLKLEDGAFVINGDETTLDFTSQSQFTGDTNPDGGEVGIYGLEANAWGVAAIFINSDNCVIKGLDRVMQRGYGVELTGNNNRVISCTISGPLYAGVKVEGNIGEPATGNIIGGTQPGEGNVLTGGNTGVRIDGPADGTVVIGNTLVGSPYHGVEVRGASCCPDYTPFNTRIGGPTPQERNWIADNGKFGEEGFPLGDQVYVAWAVGTIVEGNYIGTTEDGSAQFPGAHGTTGVAVRESSLTVIRNNLISGIHREGTNHYAGDLFGVGIQVAGPDVGTVIQGNLIGTDATGQNPVPNLNGVFFGWLQGNPSDALLGGPFEGDANVVAFNERTGVMVANEVNSVSTSNVVIEGNSIHSNGLLGIDLLDATGQFGPSPNDPGDGDAGGNGLQNFPVLETAESNGSSITIVGSLNSLSNTAFKIQFFGSEFCHPSGFGEGETFLGETTVVTDAGGNAAFDVSLPATIPADWVVTSTATRETIGATSEFSACVPIQSNQFAPQAFAIGAGIFVSGEVADLAESDNVELSARPSSWDRSSRVFLEVQGTCSTQTPPILEFTLESSVFARFPIVQSIDLYNYETNSWEVIDSRAASRDSDSTTTAEATGDLSRFVQNGTNRIEARCRYESTSWRRRFTVNVDQTVWSIGN